MLNHPSIMRSYEKHVARHLYRSQETYHPITFTIESNTWDTIEGDKSCSRLVVAAQS